MRKLIIVVGFLVLLALASPFVFGILTEGKVRDRLETTAENQLVAVRIASYDRGWLNSRARFEIGLSESYLAQIEDLAQQPGLSQMLRSFAIPVIVEFTHGPLLLGEFSGIGFLGVLARPDPEAQIIELAETTLGVPYLFELRGKSGFGSGFEFEGEIPPFGGAFADVSWDFSGLEVSGVSTVDRVVFEAGLNEVSVQSPLASGVLESLTMKGDSELRPGRFSLGTSETKLGRLTASNPSVGRAPLVIAENVSMATTTSENAEGTHLDMEVIYRIGQIAVADDFRVSDAALGLRLGHIDSEAVDEIIAAASSVQANSDPAGMVDAVMPALERVVAESPELTIDPLQFSLPEGRFDGRVHLGIDGSSLPTGRIDDLMNPAVAMGALTADADITMSKTLAEMVAGFVAKWTMPQIMGPDGEPLPSDQVTAMVDGQVAQTLTMLTTFGIVRDSGDDYSCTLQLAGGALTANGQPVPLPF